MIAFIHHGYDLISALGFLIKKKTMEPKAMLLSWKYHNYAKRALVSGPKTTPNPQTPTGSPGLGRFLVIR